MSQLKKELGRLPARRLLAGILWRLLLPLAIVWFWQIFFHTKDTKDATVSPSRAVFDSIAFFLIPAFLVIASKLYLFERYSRRYSYYQKLLDSPEVVSLPSISACVNQLETRITSRSLLQESRILTIEAEWGNGKTRVLRELQDRFLQHTHANSTDDDEPQTVMIMVDIWSFTNHLDLQFALLEELLSHPLVPAPVIRRGPFSLQFWNHNITLVPLIFLRFLLGAGKFVLKTSHVNFTVQQTEGLWHYLLRTIVDKLRSQNIRVVWCLDEIDRSSPEVAQQAILLTKRFLNHPGTTIVLPYVKNSMYWKVFNPMLCTQPDLQATMEQILIDHKEYFPSVLDSIDTQIQKRYVWVPEADVDPVAPQKDGNSSIPPATVRNWAASSSSTRSTREVSDRLVKASSRLRVGEFQILATMASEKFLQQSTLTLPFPTPEDICVLLNKTDRIIGDEFRSKLLSEKQDLTFKEEEVEKFIKELSESSQQQGGRRTGAGLRQFIGRAQEAITALQLMHSSMKINDQTTKFWKERILEVIALAYAYSDQDRISVGGYI